MKVKGLFTLALLFLIAAQSLSAEQQDPMKLGKISEEEMAMSHYAPDTTASAVVLGDIGKISFEVHPDKGLLYKLERHVRIKIFSAEGTSYANVEIPLYGKGSRQEVIGRLRGYTYNMDADGQVEKEKLRRKEAFEEDLYEHLTLYKFSLPNVKPGAIIEYEYTLYSGYLYNLTSWHFQRKIPTRYSEINLRVPDYFRYKQHMSGYEVIDVNETESYTSQMGTGPGTAYRWGMRDVPALREEPYITTLNDYAAKMDFELTMIDIPGYAMEDHGSDWNKINEEFMESSNFGKELSGGRWAEELVAGIVQETATDEEKLSKIYAYVQQNFRYNERNRVSVSQPLKKVVDERVGSVADINLLLTTLLRTAGLVANPVILSTRDHGRLNPYLPMERDFNYVIACAELGGKSLLLDATEDLLPPGQLPFRCLNMQGRLLSEQGSRWVKLLNQENSEVALRGEFTLTEEGNLEGSLKRFAGGFDALSLRKRLLRDGEESYMKQMHEKHQDWQLEELSFQDVEKAGEQLQSNFTLTINGKATPAGNRIYLDPIPEGKTVENPFQQDKRLYPIDYGCPQKETLMYSITLPEGYTVEQLPQPAVLALPNKAGLFRYQVSAMQNKLIIMSNFAIEQPFFNAEDYAYLKQFYNMVIEKQAEQVVLVKATKQDQASGE